MFVHGRNFGYKIPNYIYEFLFKCLMFSGFSLCLGFYSGFSGMNVFGDIYFTAFGVWIVNLDTLYWFAADQDIQFSTLDLKQGKMLIPHVYKEQKLHRLSYRGWAAWVLYSFASTLFIFHITQFSQQFTPQPNGSMYGIWANNQPLIFTLVFCHDF